MNYFNLQCEVPGGIGQQTLYDKTTIPWRIVNLHLMMDGWMGGEILAVSSAIIATKELCDELLLSFTGIIGSEDISIEKSDIFDTLQPGIDLPKFKRVLISNNAFSDDFALVKYGDYYNQLIISERAKNLLEQFELGNFSIEQVSKQDDSIK